MADGTGTAPVRRVPSTRGDGNGWKPYWGAPCIRDQGGIAGYPQSIAEDTFTIVGDADYELQTTMSDFKTRSIPPAPAQRHVALPKSVDPMVAVTCCPRGRGRNSKSSANRKFSVMPAQSSCCTFSGPEIALDDGAVAVHHRSVRFMSVLELQSLCLARTPFSSSPTRRSTSFQHDIASALFVDSEFIPKPIYDSCRRAWDRVTTHVPGSTPTSLSPEFTGSSPGLRPSGSITSHCCGNRDPIPVSSSSRAREEARRTASD
ncbi:hypothetical protein B0H14DRAFT_2615491 [Mycena olivaceomarginata]|nr:hypothetical protein B0H14DRAFT_2615491 [Mycena olivaceomarginata]